MEGRKKHQTIILNPSIHHTALCLASGSATLRAQAFLSPEMHLLRVPTLGKIALRRFSPGGDEPKYHLCYLIAGSLNC